MRMGLLGILAGFSVSAGSIAAQEMAPAPMQMAPAQITQAPVPMQTAPAQVTQAPASAENSFLDNLTLPKLDCPTFWVNAEYLLWWTKSGPVPVPLLSTGPNFGNPNLNGGMDTAGFRSLFGPTDINYNDLNGGRISAGMALTHGLTLEGSYFVLEQGAADFYVASNPFSLPVLARPLENFANGGANIALPLAAPGTLSGTATILSHTRLQGAELNLDGDVFNDGDLRFAWIAGFRVASLDEDLSISTTSTSLVGQASSFGPNFTNAGDTINVLDSFGTHNHFYGGQLGGEVRVDMGYVTLGMVGKVALGANEETVDVNGASTLTSATPG